MHSHLFARKARPISPCPHQRRRQRPVAPNISSDCLRRVGHVLSSPGYSLLAFRHWLIVQSHVTWQHVFMSLNLLIVDDSNQVRTSLCRWLQTVPGVACIAEAGSLNEAMKRAREDVPDLVILDMHLPDGLGLEIICSLKQLSPDLRVAVLSLHDSYRQSCLSLGADWFFDKVAGLNGLMACVQLQVQLKAKKPEDH
jgi:ActR/RegA family two-component response regulator